MKDSEEVEDNTQGLMMREEVRINLSSASYGAAKRTNQKMMSKNKRLSQHNEGPGIFDQAKGLLSNLFSRSKKDPVSETKK